MTRLVALYSPAPQSGKTTIATYLLVSGWRSVSFAAPIKRLVTQLLTELGISDDNARRLVNTDKEETIPQLRTTARHMLQTLGTEYGRNCIHPQIWTMCAEARIQKLLTEGHPVVIDDCRFPNEAALIRRLGGEVWHLSRPGTERNTTHASEGGLDDYPLFDRHLVNDGSLFDLYDRVHEILQPTPAAA
jgi:hypothetical protein